MYWDVSLFLQILTNSSESVYRFNEPKKREKEITLWRVIPFSLFLFFSLFIQTIVHFILQMLYSFLDILAILHIHKSWQFFLRVYTVSTNQKKKGEGNYSLKSNSLLPFVFSLFIQTIVHFIIQMLYSFLDILAILHIHDTISSRINDIYILNHMHDTKKFLDLWYLFFYSGNTSW